MLCPPPQHHHFTLHFTIFLNTGLSETLLIICLGLITFTRTEVARPFPGLQQSWHPWDIKLSPGSLYLWLSPARLLWLSSGAIGLCTLRPHRKVIMKSAFSSS